MEFNRTLPDKYTLQCLLMMGAWFAVFCVVAVSCTYALHQELSNWLVWSDYCPSPLVLCKRDVLQEAIMRLGDLHR